MSQGSPRSRSGEAIDAIEINGSTYMEAGLKLGYETAFAEQAQGRGKTRLMLFTDENPNVGNTNARRLHGHGPGRLAQGRRR